MNAIEGIATRAEDILARTTAAALAVSSVEGATLFEDLTRRMAEILGVDAALISVFTDASRARLVTLAGWLDGQPLRSFEYELERTPCRGVIGRTSRFVPTGVHPEFAPGTLFAAKGFDSYAAHSLLDANGQQMGLAVVLHRRPMTDQVMTEALLKIFAARAAAEIERSRAEQSYRAIFDAAEDAVFVHDWDSGAILDVSPKATELYGYPREALRWMRVGDFSQNVPPYTEADAMAHIERAKRAEAPLRIDWRGRHRDGHLMWHEVTLKPAQIGGQRRVLAFVRDVTERKVAADALRLSEEQYRAIFNASADSLVLWDANLKIVDVNPAYLRMSGFRREDVIGHRYPDSVPREYAQQRLDLVQRALRGQTFELETPAYRRDGTPFDIELRVIPFQQGGQPHVLAIARDITGRKAAEAALRASEAQYRAIFEAATDSLQLLDARHRVVDVNPAYERMYGKRREDVIGKGLAELVPERFRAERMALVQRALDGEVAELQTTGIRGDGAPFDMEVRCIPFEHHGQPHVLGIARDITERKRTEDALRASEERYRLLFDTESDAILLVDADTLQVADANQAAVEMYGYSRAELLALTATDLSVEPDETRRSIQEGQGALHVPLRQHRRRDGRVFPVEIKANRLVLDNRKIVVAAIRDVSERRESEEALRRSEARLRATIETALDCVVGMDRQGRIIEFNAAAERCFGYARHQVLGRSFSEMFIPERHRAQYGAAWSRRDASGRSRLLGRRLEMTALRADGSEFPVEATVSEAESSEGRIYVGYLRDLTAARQAERSRQQLEAQLRQAQKMEAIGQLAGGIAHDFNNILTSILGYIVLAQERAADRGDARMVAQLDHATDGCRRARDLVQQLLTFARGQRAKAEPVELCRLVRDSVPLLRASIPATITLDCDCDEPLPAALADRVQVEQVLLNLVLNARDALGGAAGRGRIAVSAAVRQERGVCSSCRQKFQGRFVELAVRDDGPGMASVVAERVFEPFFSTKTPGPHSGMGLAMVHGIVHEHRGHVVLETQPQAGTAFRVLLPLSDQADAPVADAVAAERGPRPQLAGRILVVDDERDVREFLRELLTGWGMQVDLAADGDAAWHALNQTSVDVVLSDQTMPGLDGVSLAQRIAALPAGPPVILMSGLVDVFGDEMAQAQVQAVLAKPIEPALLRASLERVLGSAR